MFDDWDAKAALNVESAIKESDKAKIEGDQRTREWFRARLGKFTGSAIHKIMGATDLKKNTFGSGAITYIMSVVNERTMTPEALELYIDDLMSKEFKQTNWGILNEPLAILEFEKQSGLKVDDTRFKANELRPYFGGSTDGMASDNNPCEIKCPFDGAKHLKHREYMLMGGVPDNNEHYTQFQSHMSNNDSELTHFVSFDPRQQEKYRYVHIEVERDDEYIAKMLNRVDMANLVIEMCMNDDVSISEAIQEVQNIETCEALKEVAVKKENIVIEKTIAPIAVIEEKVIAPEEKKIEPNKNELLEKIRLSTKEKVIAPEEKTPNYCTVFSNLTQCKQYNKNKEACKTCADNSNNF